MGEEHGRRARMASALGVPEAPPRVGTRASAHMENFLVGRKMPKRQSRSLPGRQCKRLLLTGRKMPKRHAPHWQKNAQMACREHSHLIGRKMPKRHVESDCIIASHTLMLSICGFGT